MSPDGWVLRVLRVGDYLVQLSRTPMTLRVADQELGRSIHDAHRYGVDLEMAVFTGVESLIE